MLHQAFKNEEAARKHLETVRWPNGASCPSCGLTETVSALPAKGSMGAGWYHCRQCRQKFTVRVGTLYERSHVPLHKWLYATHLLTASKKGISSHQLHRTLGVTYKTAWFMSHRIREGMKPKDSDTHPLGGSGKTVEADETFIGNKAGKRKHEGSGGYAAENVKDFEKCLRFIHTGKTEALLEKLAQLEAQRQNQDAPDSQSPEELAPRPVTSQGKPPKMSRRE